MRLAICVRGGFGGLCFLRVRRAVSPLWIWSAMKSGRSRPSMSTQRSIYQSRKSASCRARFPVGQRRSTDISRSVRDRFEGRSIEIAPVQGRVGRVGSLQSWSIFCRCSFPPPPLCSTTCQQTRGFSARRRGCAMLKNSGRTRRRVTTCCAAIRITRCCRRRCLSSC